VRIRKFGISILRENDMNAPTQSRVTTLEDMIFLMWRDILDAVPDFAKVPVEAVQVLITSTKSMMTDAGWPAVYQHDFLMSLKNTLKAGTLGHPTTMRIINLLEIELECN